MQIEDIDTPALLLRLERVERNIASMAGFFADGPCKLRPHFKTPKCAEVARMQLAAGAIGLTCAKLGEAEALAEAGVDAPILIANQVVGAPKIRRLVKLARRFRELLIAVDDPQQVDTIARALVGQGVRLGALVEVDIGMHRCGTDTPDETLALARHLRESRIEYRGIMGYEGHAVLVPDAAKRKALAEEAMARLALHRNALVDAGLEPEIVSAGGTGTFDLTGSVPGVTELQVGSYVFMDGAYRKVRSEFECALTLLTTVIHRRGRMLITDAGMKALSHEFGMPEGAELPVRYIALSEEHGHVLLEEGSELDLESGARIEILPSHGDTTINLHEIYHAIRGEWWRPFGRSSDAAVSADTDGVAVSEWVR